MAIAINRELNVVSTGVPPVIHLSQYDSDFSLVFSLYASSGTLTMPNGTTAEIRGTKRDGNGYSAAASVSGTTVTVTGDEQITACAGRNMFEIATYYNSKRLYTANFIIDVERAALDADTITSDTVLRELDAIIEGAEVAQEAAEAAEHSAAEAAAVVQSGIAITALQLMSSNYTTDSTPYLYRTTGGGVAVGTRELDEIIGGSVGWNQLCNGSSVTVTSGHKYYMVKGGTKSIGASTGSAITGLTSGTDMVTDLTLLLGSTIADYIYGLETATAGAGVAKLKEWGFFGEDYYAYDAGSLQSVTGVSAHETVGKNLLKTVTPTYSGLTIVKNSDGSFSVKGTPASSGSFYFWNDANNPIVVPDSAIMTTNYNPGGDATIILGTKDNTIAIQTSYMDTFNVPADEYTTFRIYVASGKTYNFTLKPMLRLASVSDATFEPYTKHTYPLDSSLTFRGIPKLDSNDKLYYDGDVYQSDGTVTRKYGVVDFSDSSTYVSVSVGTSGAGVKYCDISLLTAKQSVINKPCVMSSYYDFIQTNGTVVNGVYKNYGNSITIYDNAFTNKDTALSILQEKGFKIVYELATPTTETADPFAPVQICADGGTEEYITTGIVPVGHNTKYPADLAGKLDSIPALPTTAGNYRLKVTVTGGVPSYEWVSA